jgi:hypothetical protein
MPERIQLKRTRGWRLPENAVSVARPTRWGNPFTIAGAIEHEYAADEEEAREVAVKFHRNWLLGTDPGENDVYRHGNVRYDRLWMREHLPDLIGKTLSCWCAPGQACHADTLSAILSGDDEAGRVLMVSLHPYRLPVWW